MPASLSENIHYFLEKRNEILIKKCGGSTLKDNEKDSLPCLHLINPFLANVPILYPPENTGKPWVFWCFQGV